MPVKGGTKCIKYLLFGFNFIFWVSERDCRTLHSGATCSRTLDTGRGCWQLALPAPGRHRAGRERALRLPAGSKAGSRAGRDGRDGRIRLGLITAQPAWGAGPSWDGACGRVLSPFPRLGFELGCVSAPSPSPSKCQRGRQGEAEHPSLGQGQGGLW